MKDTSRPAGKPSRTLHQHLRIPADALLQEPAIGSAEPWANLGQTRFPRNQMAKPGWIPARRNQVKWAEHDMQDLLNRAGRLKCRGRRALPKERSPACEI